MISRKAIVKDAQLFKASYASVVLGREGHKVIGCVLTADEGTDFDEKLKHYDRIEGYDKHDPDESLYYRDIVTAYLIDGEGKETGETV